MVQSLNIRRLWSRHNNLPKVSQQHTRLKTSRRTRKHSHRRGRTRSKNLHPHNHSKNRRRRARDKGWLRRKRRRTLPFRQNRHPNSLQHPLQEGQSSIHQEIGDLHNKNLGNWNQNLSKDVRPNTFIGKEKLPQRMSSSSLGIKAKVTFDSGYFFFAIS